MTATFDFDRLLGSVLEADGPQVVPSALVQAALTQARGVRQHGPLVRSLDRRAWPAPRLSPANPALVRVLMVVLVLLLTLALVAAGIVVGSRLLTRDERLFGGWTQTGPMRAPRYGAALALLKDGRVLFVGGASASPSGPPMPDQPASSAELFDPSTNTFEGTSGSPSEARYDPSVTTLPDGRVLVVGGERLNLQGYGTSLATAELFDPATGAFLPTGALSTGRENHAATLLADGRVLVLGGQTVTNGKSVELASAEIFDPVAASWSTVGAMAQSRSEPSATLLPDGRVLVLGGWNGTSGPLATAELFDPSTATFTPAASMATARFSHTATLLVDGRVLVAGGPDGSVTLSAVELYDSATGRFSATGSLVTERGDHSATLLSDGRVLVAGGSNQFGSPRSSELFDPLVGKFELAASASEDHVGRAVRLSDGRLLMGGYKPELFSPTATTQVAQAQGRFDRTFTATGNLIQDRSGHTATRLADGRVLIVGGVTPSGESRLASAEIYDPESGSFTETGSMGVGEMATHLGAVFGHSVLVLGDGRVLMLGDEAYSWEPQIYDPGTGFFTRGGNLDPRESTVRQPVLALQLTNGRIVAFGPRIGASSASGMETLAYEIDPVQGRATLIADLVPACRVARQALALGNDTVVLLCGRDEIQVTAHLFNPSNGQNAPLNVPLSEGPVSMVRLLDGRILFASGVQATTLVLFDPRTGSAADGGPLPTFKGDQTTGQSARATLTTLADGRVLAISGANAALWDPNTGHSTLAAPIAGRDGHTATLLDDGRVLLAGGTHWPADRSDPRPPGAELFDASALP